MRKSFLLIFPLLLAGLAWAGGRYSVFAGGPGNGYRVGRLGYSASSVELFTEQWQFLVWPDGGGFLAGFFIVSNAGPGDEKPTLSLKYIAPDGSVRFGRSFSGRFSGAPDRFDIKVGGNYFRESGGKYQAHSAAEGLEVTLELAPLAAPYSFGDGAVRDIEKKEEFVWSIIAPRARASGTLTIDGKAIPLAGLAYADHTEGALPAFDYSTRWRSLRAPGEEFSFDLLIIEAAAAVGQPLISGALAAGPAGVLFASTDCRLTGSPPPPAAPVGPANYTWGFVCRQGAAEARGEVRVKQVLHRFSLYDSLAPFERFFAKVLTTEPTGLTLRQEHDIVIVTPSGEKRISGVGYSETLNVK